MSKYNREEPKGPWHYTDPEGREYLVQLVPMEKDPTLKAELQPKAVVFQTEEGWIRVTPVGHDFSLPELSQSDIFRLLQSAAGPPPETTRPEPGE